MKFLNEKVYKTTVNGNVCTCIYCFAINSGFFKSCFRLKARVKTIFSYNYNCVEIKICLDFFLLIFLK